MNDTPSGEKTAASLRGDSNQSENGTSARLFGLKRFERATSAEVERHLPIVRRMIELYGYGDALSYEEKVATGLIGVAIAIEKFDPSRNVKYAYWLSYQIDKAIRNESRLVIRQRGRGVQPFEEDFDPIDENDWETRSSASDREERRELAALAVAALETLDPRSRRVVQGLCFDGKTQEELARELGVSQSWTSRLARDAFKKLRREVERRSNAVRA
ncbi:MAG: sigma-70 family RNA polymerase sigma factor [Thermoguttaceae bacterium]|nr:sigma-70 family RNA polymerase sigma factor [Thermoguttaceae bacterium]